jgi:hypothetical protein
MGETHERSPEYNSWANMKQRVLNEKHPSYSDYGGRGITICREWEASFINFLKDMGTRPSVEFSIERVDVNGNYCKENCIWADRLTQNLNQRYRKDNKSGRVGVHWDSRKELWISQVQIDGKRKQLISTEDYELAVFCREEAELKYYGFIKENV